MVDHISINDQIHQFQQLVNNIEQERIKIDETFQAASLIEKLLSSWNKYKKKGKHDDTKLSMDSVIKHIRIEENNRLEDASGDEGGVKAKVIEHAAKKPRFQSNKPKGKAQVQGRFKAQSKGVCWVCGKQGHKAFFCNKQKGQSSGQANLVEGRTDIEDETIAAVVVDEVNLVGGATEWVVDTRATRHIATSRDLFLDYQDIDSGDQVFLGDARATRVIEKGKVLLKLTSGKKLELRNMLHVPTIRRNLISGALLNKANIKLVFDSDKLVLSRSWSLLGKVSVWEDYLFLTLFA